MVRLVRHVVVSYRIRVLSDSYDDTFDECAGDIEPGAGEGYGDCNGLSDGDGRGSGWAWCDPHGLPTGDGSSGDHDDYDVPFGWGGKGGTYGGQCDEDEDHPYPDAQRGDGMGPGTGCGYGSGDGRAFRHRLESGDGEGSGDGFGDGIGNAKRLDNGIDSTFVEEMAFTGGNGHALGNGFGDGDEWVFIRGVMTRAPRLKP